MNRRWETVAALILAVGIFLTALYLSSTAMEIAKVVVEMSQVLR